MSGLVVAIRPDGRTIAGLAELTEKNRIQDLMENDPIVQAIRKIEFPVTQENYLALAYPSEEMTPALMGGLPEFFEDLPER